MSTVLSPSSESAMHRFLSHRTGQNIITWPRLIARETRKCRKAVYPVRWGKWIAMDNWQPSPQRASPQIPQGAVWGTVPSMLWGKNDILQASLRLFSTLASPAFICPLCVRTCTVICGLWARGLFTNSWTLAWYQVQLELNVFQELSKAGGKWAEGPCSFPQHVCLTVGSWNWSLKSFFLFLENPPKPDVPFPTYFHYPTIFSLSSSLTDPNGVDWLWQYVIEHRAFSLHCD